MIRTIERIARTAIFAVAFMLCATGAWAAAPTATAVWEGNFDVPQNGYSITLPSGMTYSKSTTGNIVIGSTATTGAIIELNEAVDWKVSVLIKYSHLYAVAGKKVSLATVKDSAGNVIGIRSTANNALTTTGFYNGSDTGYPFVSGQRAQTGSGYLLFSYNPNDGTFAYTGRTINSLSGGKNGTLRWGSKYIDKLSIGGPVESGKTEAWAGVVIEKVALFVGEAYTNENIADYVFPSQTRWHDTDTYAYRGASSGSYFHLSNLEPVDCFDTLEGDTITLDATTDSYYWKKFASNQGATYYKAPGCALIYDKIGYTAQADCTFGLLSFGGLYVTSEQTTGVNPVYYSIIGSGERNTELGDPDGKTETYFVFDKSFTIRRSGDKTVDTKLYGVMNVSIASGMTFDLNSQPYDASHSRIKSVLTTAGTTAPVLKMSGGGKFKVYELDASIGTLDFSGVTATPFIEGNLSVTKDTKLVFPAGTAEGDSYVMCSGTLTAPTAIIKTTVQVGNGSPFMGYVTYNAETKSVSYSTTAPAYTCTVDGSSSTWSADGLTAEDFASANVTFTGSGTVEFGADATSITVGAGVTVIASSPSLSATVMLSDATSVLRMGTTGTLSGGISGSGVLEIADSVATTVPLSVTLSHTGGTTIGDNAKLTAPYASSAWGYSVTGGNTARVVLTGTSGVTSAAKSGFQSSSTWTGTVELGSFYIANLFLTHYGNASSTVCANGTSAYFPSDGWNDSNNTTAQNVKAFEIGAGGLSMPVNDNYNKISKKRFLFPCKLTGTGTFTLGLNAYAANEYNYVVFTGDVSEFQGVFNTGTGNGGRPPACVVFAATGTSYPTLSSETLSRFASDSGSFHFLSGKTVTFNANSTWTAKGGYYVDGTLTINGSLTCAGVLTVGSGAELTIDGALILSKNQKSRFTVAVVETGGKISINSSGDIHVNGLDSYGRFEIYGDLLVDDGGKFESLADMQIHNGGAAYVLGEGSLWLFYGMMDSENGNAGMITVPSVARLKTRRYAGSKVQYTKVKNTETGKVIFKPTDSSVTTSSIGDFTDYVVIGNGSVEVDVTSPNLTLPTNNEPLTLFSTSTDLSTYISAGTISVTGNANYYLKQTDGAVTLQLYAAKDNAGGYYRDATSALGAIAANHALTLTILDGTEEDWTADALSPYGLERSGTSVYYVAATVTDSVSGAVVAYPSVQEAIDNASALIGQYVTAYQSETVTAAGQILLKIADGAVVTLNSSKAGCAYDGGTSIGEGIYMFSDSEQVAATFKWKTSVASGSWGTIDNWTSDDGTVSRMPGRLDTVIFESATLVVTPVGGFSFAALQANASVTIKRDSVAIDDRLTRTVSAYGAISGTGSLTLNDGVNLANASGASLSIGVPVTVAGATALTVAEGVAASFTGSGTLTLDAITSTPIVGDSWTGTVWLKNQSDIQIIPANYGNANSVIRFTGITGWIADGTTCSPAFEFVDEGDTKALTLNSYSTTTPSTITFNEFRGSGTFATVGGTADAYPRTNFRILKWDDFVGSLDVDRGRAVFGTDTISNDDWRYIYISEDAGVTIAAGKSFTANQGLRVYGELTVESNDALSSKAVQGSGTIIYEVAPNNGTTKPSFHATLWTGVVEFQEFAAAGIKLAEYGTSNSKIKINGITSGHLMWEDQNVQAEVVLAGDVNITATSHRNYTYAHISGTGSFSVSNSNSAKEDPSSIVITQLDVSAGSVGMAVTNNTATTLAINKLVLPNLPLCDTKVLAVGGTGEISLDVGNVKVNEESLPAKYKLERRHEGEEGDGFYVYYNGTIFSVY